MTPHAIDPLYLAARRVLLDALQAVHDHRDAIVLVGAQAVYVHAGEADLAVAPYTKDGDLGIDPDRLGQTPLLENVLGRASFTRDPDMVGRWLRDTHVSNSSRAIPIDLLVPESVGGAGRRSARIPPHGKNVARKVVGREAALVDKDWREITALEPGDERRCKIWVAGPAGLLVAKIHKIADRTADVDRVSDKDALDVYRVLRATPTKELAGRVRSLRSSALAGRTTVLALGALPDLFGTPSAPGCAMAVRAAGPLADSETLAASLVALADDLVEALAQSPP